MMVPNGVLNRCTATPMLVTILAILCSCLCLGLTETGYARDVDTVATDSREAPDNKLESLCDESIKDIGRLLFKQMRFRDLSMAAHQSVGASYPFISRWLGHRPWHSRNLAKNTNTRGRNYSTVLKKKNEHEKLIVDNLAALLSNMKSRDTSSQLRMPSLRFG